MDQLAQHQDFLQNRGTEIDMRPEGEHEDEGDGSQDDHFGEQEEEIHFEEAKGGEN